MSVLTMDRAFLAQWTADDGKLLSLIAEVHYSAKNVIANTMIWVRIHGTLTMLENFLNEMEHWERKGQDVEDPKELADLAGHLDRLAGRIEQLIAMQKEEGRFTGFIQQEELLLDRIKEIAGDLRLSSDEEIQSLMASISVK